MIEFDHADKQKVFVFIVLVDDELVAMRVYQQDLELAGYKVRHCTSTAEIKVLLSNQESEWSDLFIMDIMIPPEPLYSNKKTNLGLMTGLFLAQDIRNTYPHAPIIFLSNTSFESVLVAVKRLTSRLEDCIYLQKQETKPFELTDTVTRYFKELKLDPARRHRILRRLFDSLMLQPNISGVGINLKKFGNTD